VRAARSAAVRARTYYVRTYDLRTPARVISIENRAPKVSRIPVLRRLYPKRFRALPSRVNVLPPRHVFSMSLAFGVNVRSRPGIVKFMRTNRLVQFGCYFNTTSCADRSSGCAAVALWMILILIYMSDISVLNRFGRAQWQFLGHARNSKRPRRLPFLRPSPRYVFSFSNTYTCRERSRLFRMGTACIANSNRLFAIATNKSRYLVLNEIRIFLRRAFNKKIVLI